MIFILFLSAAFGTCRPSGSRLLDLLRLRSRRRRRLSVDGVLLRRFFLGWPEDRVPGDLCRDRFRPVSFFLDVPRGDFPRAVEDRTSDMDAPSRGSSGGC